MIYIIIAAVLFFLFIVSCCSGYNGKITGLLAFSILSFLAIFRGEVGTDYHSYILLWQSIVSGESAWYKEPGFVYSIMFLSHIGINAEIYFIFLSLFTLIIAYISAVRLKINIIAFFLTYFLFLYLGYVFNIMRQGIAMSLFLLALTYLFANKKRDFFITSMIAISFHYISALIGVVYFWCRIRLRVIIFFVLGMILFKFTGGVNSLLSVIFLQFFPNKVESYITGAENNLSAINMIQRVMLVSLLFLLYYLSDKDKLISMLLKIYLLGFGLYFLLSDYSIISGRVYTFFCIVVPAIFARYCYIQSSKSNNLILGFVFFMILFPSLWILAYTPEFDYFIK